MRLDLMVRKRVLAGIAVLLMGASLVFTGSASAHNIDQKKAREAAREYAREVRDKSGGRYLHYSTFCYKMFANHNHYVRCEIEYQNAQDKAKGVYTCKESINVYMRAHGNVGENYTLYGKHASANACGGYFLDSRIVG
jgi:hypothetical protein